MKKVFLAFLFFILIIPNSVFAKQIPLSHHNCRELVSALNISNAHQIQLSSPKYFMFDNDSKKHRYSSVISGGNELNGVFLFDEDSNGNLYTIVCSFNLFDYTVFSNVVKAQIYFLRAFGLNDSDMKKLIGNITMRDNSRNNIRTEKGGEIVWSNSIGGYVMMVSNFNISTNNLIIGLVAIDSKNEKL